MMRIPYFAMMALLTAPVGAAEQQYTQEQQDSCGSILCLAGGGALIARRGAGSRLPDDPGRCAFRGRTGGAGQSGDRSALLFPRSANRIRLSFICWGRLIDMEGAEWLNRLPM